MMTQTKIPTLDCPCGSMSFPIGIDTRNELFSIISGNVYPFFWAIDPTSFIPDSYGMFVTVNGVQNRLLHNTPVLLDKQQTFVTISNHFTNSESYNPSQIIISSSSDFIVDHVVQLRVLEYPSRRPLHVQLLGNFGYQTNLGQELIIPIRHIQLSSEDVPSFAYILEFRSLCDFGVAFDPCCDKLPTEIQIDGLNKICIPLTKYYPPSGPSGINIITTTTEPPACIGTDCSGVYSASSIYLK